MSQNEPRCCVNDIATITAIATRSATFASAHFEGYIIIFDCHHFISTIEGYTVVLLATNNSNSQILNIHQLLIKDSIDYLII